MASASKKTKTLYKGSDLVDKFLLNELAKNIRHDKLDSMAKDLGLLDMDLTSDHLTQVTLREKVLSSWSLQLGSDTTVEKFIKEVSLLETRGYLESDVWKSLEPYIEAAHVHQVLVDQSKPQSQNQSPSEKDLDQSPSDTHLSSSSLGKKGYFLSNFIKLHGENSRLETIRLRRYSMPKDKWVELLQFIPNCKFLWHLDLSRNALGNTGLNIARSIISPTLRELILIRCSMSEQVWTEIFQSLSACKQLCHLDLSENSIGEAGLFLAESIRSWSDDAPLKKIFLESCSIPGQVWAEVLQTLSSCKKLSHLNLSKNIIGQAGQYLAQSLASLGEDSILQYLNLHQCSIPEQVWVEILQSLSTCKNLNALNLSNNKLGESAFHLAQSMVSWGDNPNLQFLDLSDCSIPKNVSQKLLQSISSCGHLKQLYFSLNSATGCLSSFLSQPTSAQQANCNKLHLGRSAINKSDLQHLTNLIRSNKLPRLKELCLEENSWNGFESEFKELKKACAEELSRGFILHVNDEQLKIEMLQRENEQGATQYTQDELDVAYKLACQKETVQVFNARLNLVGHREAGKTSLATRLMGQEFKDDVQSTDGVSIHHVKAKFKKSNMNSEKWMETSLNVSTFLEDFGPAVIAKIKSRSSMLRKRSSTPWQKLQAPSKMVSNTRSTSDVSVKKNKLKTGAEENVEEISKANSNLETEKTVVEDKDTNENNQPTKEQNFDDTLSIHSDVGEDIMNVLGKDDWIRATVQADKNSLKQEQESENKVAVKEVDDPEKDQKSCKEGEQGKTEIVEMIDEATKEDLGAREIILIEENTPQQEMKEKEQELLKPEMSSAGQFENQQRKSIEGMKEEMEYSEESLQTADALPFSVTLWDLGGQNEFITTHHLFLDVESTTLIVMDITKPLHQMLDAHSKLGHPNTPAAVLHYWLNSLQVQISKNNVQPNVALVLTHKDMIKNQDVNLYTAKYISDILSTLQSKPYANFINRDNIYIVDNKSGNDTEFENLRNQLFWYLSQQENWGRRMPVKWMKLKAEILKKAKREKYLNLITVTRLGNQFGMNDKEIESFLRIQNTLGNIIYYTEPELREIIITNPQWLVDMVSALITNHKFLQSRKLKEETLYDLMSGQVTSDGLEDLWKENEIEFLKQIMIKFNLIVPVNGGLRYIIPSLLPARNVNLHQEEGFHNMEIIYNEIHNPELGNMLLIGSFHKLISECSKIKGWKLCLTENHPSYTDAIFELKKEIKLVLTLLKADSLRVSIWCSKNLVRQDIPKLVTLTKATRRITFMKMEKLGIAQGDTFKVICLKNKSTDICLCLVKVKEYQHPIPDTFSYWYVEQKCALHGEILQLDRVPSLLMLSSDAGGEAKKGVVRRQRHYYNRKLPFLMEVHGKKEYLATVTTSAKCTIQDPDSNICIEVNKGPNTIVMQYMHTNLEKIGCIISNDECIVSPVITIHTTEIADQSFEFADDQEMVVDPSSDSEASFSHQDRFLQQQPELMAFQDMHSSVMDTNQQEQNYGHRYKVIIPHHVEQHHLLPLIKVKLGNINSKLSEVHNYKFKDGKEPYHEVLKDHVILYIDHFCDVVCTCTGKVCASKLLAIPFGQRDSEPDRKETHAKVKTYLCNYLYKDKSYKKELREEAAEIGLNLLEQLWVPLKPASDLTKCNVTIRLKAAGSDTWCPSVECDEKWDASKKQMTETTELSDIINGHLCKSNPFDVANFGLKAKGVLDTFHGNLSVHVSGMRSRSTPIRIPPSQANVVETTTGAEHLQTTTDNKELTDGMILKVAKRINKPIDLLSLGTLGLDMKEEVLAGHLQNKKDDIHMAAYEVLKQWKNSQPKMTVAYVKLCKALGQTGVDMESLIEEVLK